MTTDPNDHEVQPGTLYIVPTPIGNLGDCSPRATEILTHVDVIAAEDTRNARHLFGRLGIRPPAQLVSYHDHNAHERASSLVHQMTHQHHSVALISDAGTPGCSDPGLRLVRAAIDADLTIVPLPGPAAFLCALVASGMPTDRFTFIGFLPHTPAKRRARLKELQDHPHTLCLYASPHRILGLLQDTHDILGPRPICLARELTKRHEELLRGTPLDIHTTLSQRDAIRGEISLIIQGNPPQPTTQDDPQLTSQALALIKTLQAHKLPPKTIKSIAAAHLGISKKRAYELMLGLDG